MPTRPLVDRGATGANAASRPLRFHEPRRVSLRTIATSRPSPALSDIFAGARKVLDDNWREGRTNSGLTYAYTCPDATKYPDQFFWDSCFHALAWSRLDIKRAMLELRSLAAAQQASGLIGHTIFWNGPVRLEIGRAS